MRTSFRLRAAQAESSARCGRGNEPLGMHETTVAVAEAAAAATAVAGAAVVEVATGENALVLSPRRVQGPSRPTAPTAVCTKRGTRRERGRGGNGPRALPRVFLGYDAAPHKPRWFVPLWRGYRREQPGREHRGSSQVPCFFEELVTRYIAPSLCLTAFVPTEVTAAPPQTRYRCTT